MKMYFIAMLLTSVLISPMAAAEGGYGGLSLGAVKINDDIDVNTTNLGIALGSINASGLGYEFVYSISVVNDSETVNGTKFTADTDIFSIYAVYQTPGDVYLKLKGGYALLSLRFDADSGDSLNESATDFSYGVAGGIKIGGGALELSYYKLPDFDSFADIDVESESDLINLTYLWAF